MTYHKYYEDNLKKLGEIAGRYSTPRELFYAPKKSWVEQARWDIPDEFIIKVAPVGAFIMKEDNPNQKYTDKEFRKEVLDSIEVGACAFHTHARDEQGRHVLDLEALHKRIDPIKDKFGQKVLVCGSAEGGATLADSLRSVSAFQGIMETAAIAVTAVNLTGDYSRCTTPQIVQTSADLVQKVGCKPEITLHNLGDISLVKRWLIDSGVLQKPYYFRLAVGNPGWGYIEDPYTLLECISYMTRELKRIDPDCAIMLGMSGRAGLFVVPLAIMLGLIGVRVGMEDAMYIYPHKDEMIKDNASLVRHVVAMVEALGRKVGTADDYRRFIGKG